MKNFKITAVYPLLLGFILLDTACSNIKAKEAKETKQENISKKYVNNKIEAQFLIDLAEIKIHQISLGQLAQQKSTRAFIIQLGKKVEEENRNSLCELEEIAKALEIAIPISLSENGKESYQRLSNKSAKYFDNTYAEMVIDDYKEEIALIDLAATNSQQPKIVAWATTAIPSLKTVLLDSQECKEKCD